MFEELLEVAKSNKTFTKEQAKAFGGLSKKEKDKILKAIEKARDKELDESINREFKRVYEKELANKSDVAKFFSSDSDVTDNNFLEKYHDDRNYSLNEVMVAVIRDEDTPQDIKEKAKERLYIKNIGLIGSQLKRFAAKNDGKMTMEDLGQDCRVVFFDKVLPKYKFVKEVKFSTFATIVFKNYLATIHKQKINRQRAQEVSFETPIVDDSGSVKTLLDYQVDPNPTAADTIRKESEKEIIKEQLNKLNLEQKFVAYCRFGIDGVPKKTQAEIADYMHMSQANVSKIETTMRIKLKQLLDEAGMF